MMEIIKMHPDLLLFVLICTIALIITKIKGRKYNLKMVEMESALRFTFVDNGLIDSKIYDSVDVSTAIPLGSILKVPSGLKVDVIAQGFSKGYDLFISHYDKYEEGTIPWHKHFKSTELFYVIKGEFTLSVKDDDHKLGKGMSFFIPRNTLHSLRFHKPCTILTIAKPSLFSRIGRFYDKISKKI